MTSKSTAFLSQYKLITVEGNTGAGKTSLARMIAQEYEGNLILETFVDNPFLPRFYAKPEQFAFHTEIFFLIDRNQQIKDFLNSNDLQTKLNISDYLFNKSVLYASVNLDAEENQLFERVFEALYPKLPEPELVIYVHSTVPRLIKNIQKRGRDFEQVVDPNYLQRVEDLYFNYFKQNPQLKVLILHTDELDFVNNQAHYQQILTAINKNYESGISHIYF